MYIKDVEQERRELFEQLVNLPDGVEWDQQAGKYVGVNFWLADYGLSVFNIAIDTIEIKGWRQ